MSTATVATVPVVKRRGRPKGSKNKAKLVIVKHRSPVAATAPTPVPAVAKRSVGRPRKIASVPPVVVKHPAAKGTVAPKKRVPPSPERLGTGSGTWRTMDKLTGYALDSNQYKIAYELLKGGETRQEVIDRLRTILPPKTKGGAIQPVPNLVSGVYKNLLDNGFILDAHWQMLEPTPVSKRKATRARNLAAKKSEK